MKLLWWQSNCWQNIVIRKRLDKYGLPLNTYISTDTTAAAHRTILKKYAYINSNAFRVSANRSNVRSNISIYFWWQLTGIIIISTHYVVPEQCRIWDRKNSIMTFKFRKVKKQYCWYAAVNFDYNHPFNWRSFTSCTEVCSAFISKNNHKIIGTDVWHNFEVPIMSHQHRFCV